MVTTSKLVKFNNVATTLLIKCTLIGIKILSVFKYKIHMHIPNKNALVIPPKSCPIPNMNEDISMAGTTPVLIFNLLNNTPLNINSSITGAKIIEAIASRIITLESIFVLLISKIEVHVGLLNPINIS